MTTLLLATIVCPGVEPSIAPGEWERVERDKEGWGERWERRGLGGEMGKR